MSIPTIHKLKIKTISIISGNQKTAFEAVYGGLRLVQAPGLSPKTSIAGRKTLSRIYVDNFGTVEVAGIEPASPWLIIQDLSQSTPTAHLSYQMVRRFSILIFAFSIFIFNLLLHDVHAGLTQNIAPNNNTLATGLIGYWTFDGKDMVASSTGKAILDRSGSGASGFFHSNPAMSVGRIGQALNFDGVDDYISIPNSAAVNPTSQITLLKIQYTFVLPTLHTLAAHAFTKNFRFLETRLTIFIKRIFEIKINEISFFIPIYFIKMK